MRTVEFPHALMDSPARDTAPGAPLRRARSAADYGLICGYRFEPDGRVHPIEPSDVLVAPDISGAVTWLHLNASRGSVLRWLQAEGDVPAAARAVLEERESRPRMEPMGEGMLVVINDFVFGEEGDPDDVATLWGFVTPARLLTARFHPLRTPDRLRSEARSGLALRGAMDLLSALLEYQIEAIGRLVLDLATRADHIEDRILRDITAGQRVELGLIRRGAARLRRHFRPQRAALQKLLAHPPTWLQAADLDRLRSVTDDLAYFTDEAEHQQERAKFLQEELGSRDSQAMGRNLYMLTLYTVVFMPMTLISGIFGMNVAGLPGTEGAGSFWWVMGLIVAGGALTLGALLLRLRR
ncbi:MAG TPA: CorA family divalent cation transporter [Burkholderiales bacterium]|nr:CorA family divalent cation transporter [Burkholderiales bacterium]